MARSSDELVRVFPSSQHAHSLGNLIQRRRQRNPDFRVIEKPSRHAELADGRGNARTERSLDASGSILVRQLGKIQRKRRHRADAGKQR